MVEVIFDSDGSDDDTPFDGSGLRDKEIKNRAQLNRAEFDCIQRVTEKYLLNAPSTTTAPFTFTWLYKLHEEMLGKVWEWAGQQRATEKTLGVRPEMIPTKVGELAMKAYQRRNEYDPILVVQTAAEFHHCAVATHPFEDGNGRWSRMLANIWLIQHKQPLTFWPDQDLRETASPIRIEYINAIKAADNLDFKPLIELHKRYQEA